MSQATEWRINADERFPRLANAPIVEAVIQFAATPKRVLAREELRREIQPRFAAFGMADQLRFEADFAIASNGMNARHKADWDGLLITSNDGKQICQWKPASIIYSWLATYQTWDLFLAAAMPFWEAFEQIQAPEIIEGVGVRFISQIELAPNQQASEYVAQTPPLFSNLGLNSDSFFHEDTVPVRGHPYVIRLIRAMQQNADSKTILVVDIDVSTTTATLPSELPRKLSEMRYLKNRVFFGFMKDAENKFQ